MAFRTCPESPPWPLGPAPNRSHGLQTLSGNLLNIETESAESDPFWEFVEHRNRISRISRIVPGLSVLVRFQRVCVSYQKIIFTPTHYGTLSSSLAKCKSARVQECKSARM